MECQDNEYGRKIRGSKKKNEKIWTEYSRSDEVRWKVQSNFNSDGMKVIYSGGDQCKQGVALILDEEVGRRVIEVNQVSVRLIIIKINAKPVDVVLIQVYMPTTEYENEEIEEMCEQIENVIN